MSSWSYGCRASMLIGPSNYALFGPRIARLAGCLCLSNRPQCPGGSTRTVKGYSAEPRLDLLEKFQRKDALADRL